MTVIHISLGVALIASSAAAGLLGGWRWYRVEPSPVFWRLLRVSQVLVVLAALHGGIWRLTGNDVSGLHLLYGVLPIAIHFIAEQFRVAAAETVLETRGLENAAAVGGLPEAEQRSVVLAIVRRELGVMSAAALVVVFLGLRAAGWL